MSTTKFISSINEKNIIIDNLDFEKFKYIPESKEGLRQFIYSSYKYNVFDNNTIRKI